MKLNWTKITPRQAQDLLQMTHLIFEVNRVKIAGVETFALRLDGGPTLALIGTQWWMTEDEES